MFKSVKKNNRFHSHAMETKKSQSRSLEDHGHDTVVSRDVMNTFSFNQFGPVYIK